MKVSCILQLFILVFGFACGCKNDIETIQALTSDLDLPDQTASNIEIAYTDSGIIQGLIRAPEAIKYSYKEEPFVEFPKGIHVIFFDDSGSEESYIRSNYAIYYNAKRLWEAREQVVAENPMAGEKLETDQLFWDQQAERIYSEKFCKITNSDGVFFGEGGLEARQDMSKWRLKGLSGTVNVTDEPQPPASE